MRRAAARTLAATVALLALASCSGGDGGVVEAGDRLATPADWVERRELVVEKSLFCGGPAPCPHLEREWDIPGPVTVATVEKVFADLGSPSYDETAPGCVDMSQCRFTFSDGTYRWELAIVHGLSDLPDGAGLHVQPDEQKPSTDHTDPECWLVGPDDREIIFARVPEPKTDKNRMDLCIRPTDRTREEEVDRILALGASLVDDRRDGPDKGWAVLADTESNEFCVLTPYSPES